MRSLYIATEHLYPLESTTSGYLTKVAEKLSKLSGFQVFTTTVLGDSEELPFLEGHCRRLPHLSMKKNNVFSKALKWLYATLVLTLYICFKAKKGDVVFTVTNPAFIVLSLALLKKVRGYHYVLLVYDIFPENILAAKITKKHAFSYRFLKVLFDWAYAQADQLIVIGRDMEKVIQKKTKNKVQTLLISNWCDVVEVIPQEKNENTLIHKLNLQDKVVCAFTGNFGRVQGIENLLKAASLVENERFVLLFVGEGAMYHFIEEHVEKHPNGNVIYAGAYPSKDQNIFLNACDIAIVSLASSMYGLGVPSKFYYNMAAAKPILYIGDVRSEVSRVISEHDIGYVVEPDAPQKLAEVFEQLCDDKSLAEKGLVAREIVECKYSKEVTLSQYYDFFKSLLNAND